jgi:hypothetical protein
MGFVADAAQGFLGYQEGQAEAQQYKFNARTEMIAADQDSDARLSDLNSTLSAINARRTSRGLSVSSPTGMVIAQNLTKQAEAGISAVRFNHAAQAQSDLFGATQSLYKGDAALLGAFLQMGQQAGQAAMMAGG